MGAEQSTVGGPLDTSDAGLDARFATLDKDQSGKLSRAKAEAGIMALYGVEIDDATLNSMFKAADGNQDGAVDLAEFKAIVRAGAATGVATNATSSKVPAPASLVSLDQQSTDVILSGMEEVLDQMPAPAIASGGSLLELKTHLAALGESATATNTKRSSIAGSFRGLLSWRPTGFSTSRSGGGLTERLFRAKRGIKHNDPKLVFEGLHGCSLHAAINQPSLLRESIKYAKDVSAKDADNDRTPLHWAAARGHLRCIQMLIDAGANKEALDANGKTAAQLAESSAQPMASTLILFGPPLPDQRPVHAGLCGLSLHAALNQPTRTRPSLSIDSSSNARCSARPDPTCPASFTSSNGRPHAHTARPFHPPMIHQAPSRDQSTKHERLAPSPLRPITSV